MYFGLYASASIPLILHEFKLIFVIVSAHSPGFGFNLTESGTTEKLAQNSIEATDQPNVPQSNVRMVVVLGI